MSETATRAQGRPKDPEKRAAIMEAARKLFLDQGYDRTTVDAIAGEAGVSKLTVYSHFEDKDGLFKSLVTCKCAEYFEGQTFDDLAGLGPEQALLKMSHSFFGLMLNPDVMALHRLLMASATHNPELTAMFYETGPRPTMQTVADVLSGFHRKGELHIEGGADGAWRAADHLLSMLRGLIHLRALLNIEPHPGAEEIDAHVRDCVATFIRAYKPD